MSKMINNSDFCFVRTGKCSKMLHPFVGIKESSNVFLSSLAIQILFNYLTPFFIFILEIMYSCVIGTFTTSSYIY